MGTLKRRVGEDGTGTPQPGLPFGLLGPPEIGALSHSLFWLGDSVPKLKSTKLKKVGTNSFQPLKSGGPNLQKPATEGSEKGETPAHFLSAVSDFSHLGLDFFGWSKSSNP